MNIAVMNDDGYDAIGLRVMRKVVGEMWPDANIATLSTVSTKGGRGMSVDTKALDDMSSHEMNKWGFKQYVCPCTPVDLVYLACMQNWRFFDNKEPVDMVFSGVNHGANVGVDVFHSGTVGAAMMAWRLFGVSGIAASQAYPDLTPKGAISKEKVDEYMTGAETLLRKALSELVKGREGEIVGSLNINLPYEKEFNGKMQNTMVAMASRFRGYGDLSGERSGKNTDMYNLKKGCITWSELLLEVNVPGWF